MHYNTQVYSPLLYRTLLHSSLLYSLPRHLEDHFRAGHLICEDPLCLAKRYVVFSNGIDLAAHGMSHHPFAKRVERHVTDALF